MRRPLLLPSIAIVFLISLAFVMSGCKKKPVQRVKAELGDAQAQYDTAIGFFEGKENPRNPTKGMDWLKKSADQGNSSAILSLALAYYAGTGGTVNREESVKWFQKAANAGDPVAENYLGAAY